MRKFGEPLLWAFFVLLPVIPFVYGIFFSAGHAYWDNVASGLLATAAALIGGIPFALAIDRAIKRKEDSKRQIFERQREREILELLMGELNDCHEHLISYQGTPGRIPLRPINTDLWHTISVAGMLNYISKPQLLNDLSSVYSLIDFVRSTEDQLHKSIYGMPVVYPDGSTAISNLTREARKYDVGLSRKIAKVIEVINQDLMSDSK